MRDLAENLIERLRAHGWRMAAAESCTGGLIASIITDEPGASVVFDRGYVTYSNESKQEILGVPASLLREYGAVSAPVAEAMAKGALKYGAVDMAVSCTGIAGPDGGTDIKPVGLVYIGVAVKGHPVKSFEHHFHGTRQEIREQAADAALKYLIETLAEYS